MPVALHNIADTYENELNTALKVMTSMIEPVMIVCMALFVALLLVALLQPMFTLTSNISR